MLWSTVRLFWFVYFRTETENIDTGHYDRQIPDSDVTTEASDFYNVYYPVMEAQTVISSNGKASRNTGNAYFVYKYLQFFTTS
jgi:hypothetical protein